MDVVNPGTVLGRDCIIYPGRLSGVLLSGHSILKVRQHQPGFESPLGYGLMGG